MAFDFDQQNPIISRFQGPQLLRHVLRQRLGFLPERCFRRVRRVRRGRRGGRGSAASSGELPGDLSLGDMQIFTGDVQWGYKVCMYIISYHITYIYIHTYMYVWIHIYIYIYRI